MAGDVDGAQLGAWLMAVYIKGLSVEETGWLTRHSALETVTFKIDQSFKVMANEQKDIHISTNESPVIQEHCDQGHG